jgi:Cof subfamily protein (haloacid dehalogenase superfamily)
LIYRLLAVDLDGTIVDGDLQISARVRAALLQAQDAAVHVTLASGRPPGQVLALAKDLSIHEPIICHQGAVVKHPDTLAVYFHHGVPVHLAREFIDLARDHGWSLCMFLDDQLYAECFTPAVRFFAEFSPIPEGLQVVEDLHSVLGHAPTKLIVIVEAEQGAAVDAILQARFAGTLHVARSFPRFVEVTSLAASKGQALAALANLLNVSQHQTVAIGDNDNDADMVAWAGLGVAMGNASPKVKAVADYVAPTIEADGAAEAVERFILGATHA